MRNNQPVTQREFPFPAGQTLVSVTDLQGRITYCNPAFVLVSGYSTEELLGQPHNLVRHPDMPAEAFRDLWATIESGSPWQGVVKNRRKDGDHYWVLANATPLRQGERIVGYLSVRGPVGRDRIQAAEALYAQLNQEAAKGRLRTGLHAGHVVPLGAAGRAVRAMRNQLRRWGVDGALGLSAALGAGVAAQLLPAVAWVPLAAALAAGAWWLTHRRQQAALGGVVDDALRLAAGDLLHVPATGTPGHIGQLQLALNQLGQNMRAAVGDVRHQVENVRGAVREIAAGNQDLSERTESQASSLEETAASMEQINGTVRNTAGHAAEGARMAAETARVAEQSQQAVMGAVQAMQGISESSRRIGDIIQVIEGVAFQTNILALNAAVEAARAGESGRGFAVVASEVRMLAQRTSEAAREIRQLISEAAERVAGGVQQTDAAQSAMGQALDVVGRVASVLQQIDHAAQEQQLGVSQVNEAVTHMDGVTQQNAAMVEQLAAAAQALDGQVNEVTQAMRLFRLRPNEASLAEQDAVALRRESKGAAGAASMDMGKAIAAHLAWKTKLRNAIEQGEKLDVETVRRDDRCPLGQWLHGEGHRSCGHAPAFMELLGRHAEFHREVGQVAQLVNAGQKDQARSALEGGTAFARATQATVVAIKALQQESCARSAPEPRPSPAARAPAPATAPAPAAQAVAGDDWEQF